MTATTREAEDLVTDLAAWAPAGTAALFPSWETLPHERLSPRSDTVGARLAVLRRLAHPEEHAEGPLRVVVAPVRAVLQPLVAGLGELSPVTLRTGRNGTSTAWWPRSRTPPTRAWTWSAVAASSPCAAG